MSSRPLPVPDSSSAAYWEAATRHELALAKCAQCGCMTLPPSISCPYCRSTEPAFTFEAVSGRGNIRTWTIVRRAFLPGFQDDIPFMLVDVQLDDHPGVRIVGRLLDGPDAPVSIGAGVEVAFEDLSPEISVPAFRLAGPA